MKNWPFWIGILVTGLLVAVLFWPQEQPEPVPPATEPQPQTTSAPPPVVHPVDAIQARPDPDRALIDPAQPLPTLEESDRPMQALLARLFTAQKLDRYVFLEHFIERFVVMVDNLPRAELPATHRPLKKIPGRFQVRGDRQSLELDPANFQRYTPLVAMLEEVDRPAVVAAYVHLYPLFQQAYRQLGAPDAYFNDRLIEVLDHLLAAPQVSGTIHLVQPRTLYLYADPDLEALSAGRKILLRIGPDNARRVKALLRAYRQLLSGLPPGELSSGLQG